MILAKQYCHERWNSSVCHWFQNCLYLRFLQPLQQLLYSNFKPISTFTTMPWRASNMTHVTHISIPTILGGQTAGFGSSLDESQHRGLEHLGISTIPGIVFHILNSKVMEVCFKNDFSIFKLGDFCWFQWWIFRGCKLHVLCIWANLIRHHQGTSLYFS